MGFNGGTAKKADGKGGAIGVWRRGHYVEGQKKLTLGMRMYLGDYDQQFPDLNWGQYCGNADGCIWFAAIYPYVKNVQIYQCPGTGQHSRGFPCDYNVYNSNFDWPSTPIEYGSNICPGGPYHGGTPARLAELEHSSEVLVFADCYHLHPGNKNLVTAGFPDRPVAERSVRHNGGSNIGFADGHGRWFKAESMKLYNSGGPLRYFPNEW